MYGVACFAVIRNIWKRLLFMFAEGGTHIKDPQTIIGGDFR